MTERIKGPGDYLRHGQGHGIIGIKHGNICLCAQQPGLYLLFFVGNHSAVIHFRTRSRCRDNGDHGHKAGRIGMVLKFHFPNILVRFGLRGDNLTAVNDRTSANRKNQVNPVFTDELCALLHLCIGGIGHDTGKFRYHFSSGFQIFHKLRVNTIFLYGAAAIGEHDVVSILFQQIGQVFFCTPPAEINFGFVFKDKIVHSAFSSDPFICSSQKATASSIQPSAAVPAPSPKPCPSPSYT